MSTAIGTVYRCNRIAHATDLSSKQGSAMTLEKLARWWIPKAAFLPHRPRRSNRRASKLVHDIKKGSAMKRKSKLTIAIATAALAVLGATTVYAQDKYSLKSPSGIAFSDFRGYED